MEIESICIHRTNCLNASTAEISEISLFLINQENDNNEQKQYLLMFVLHASANCFLHWELLLRIRTKSSFFATTLRGQKSLCLCDILTYQILNPSDTSIVSIEQLLYGVNLPIPPAIKFTYGLPSSGLSEAMVRVSVYYSQSA